MAGKVNYWTKLKAQIERGKKGLNTGIPFAGFTTFSDQIDNVQQGRYDVVFAGTGVGKTSFVNSTYVYGAIEFLQSHPDYIHNLEVIYYSLEIPPEDQIAKHICYLLWEEHGILTTVKEIKSRGNKSIPPEVEILIDDYEKKIEEINSKYITFRSSMNPDFLYKDVMSYARSRGTVVRDGHGSVVKYIPKDPSLITLIVVDHIGLIDEGKYKDKKAAIDQASKYLVRFRNWFNFSPLVLTQINRSSEGMDRRKDDNWMPMLSDIKNTGSLSEDANTVIALASPYAYGIDKYSGFDITKYKDRFRIVKICKNRDGTPNLVANMLFIGEIGSFHQLPQAAEISGMPSELRKIKDYYVEQSKKRKNAFDRDS